MVKLRGPKSDNANRFHGGDCFARANKKAPSAVINDTDPETSAAISRSFGAMPHRRQRQMQSVVASNAKPTARRSVFMGSKSRLANHSNPGQE